jgi:hypothetical protein
MPTMDSCRLAGPWWRPARDDHRGPRGDKAMITEVITAILLIVVPIAFGVFLLV